jgi:hypothetical protein
MAMLMGLLAAGLAVLLGLGLPSPAFAVGLSPQATSQGSQQELAPLEVRAAQPLSGKESV